MIEVNTDSKKKRITLVLKGHLSERELKKGLKDFQVAVDVLKPSFDVINDISGFKAVNPIGKELIKEGMYYCVKNGVKRIVRISNRNTLGKNQLTKVSKEVGFDPINVSTLEEAKSILDNKRE